MGVDFFACDNCGATFPDCGPHARCESCNQKLCPGCMKEHGVRSVMADLDFDGDDSDDEYSQCPFCDFTIASNATLLECALADLGVTKEEFIARLQGKPKA